MSALEKSLFKSFVRLLSWVVWYFVIELDEVLDEPGLPVRPKEVAFYPGEQGRNGRLLSRWVTCSDMCFGMLTQVVVQDGPGRGEGQAGMGVR